MLFSDIYKAPAVHSTVGRGFTSQRQVKSVSVYGASELGEEEIIIKGAGDNITCQGVSDKGWEEKWIRGRHRVILARVVREVLSGEMVSEVRSEGREGLGCSWTSGKSPTTSANTNTNDPKLGTSGVWRTTQKPMFLGQREQIKRLKEEIGRRGGKHQIFEMLFCSSFQIFLLLLLQSLLCLFVDLRLSVL